MTQNERLLEHLRTHTSISNAEALTELGISSPTRRWTELRRMGHNIRSRKVVELNRYGEPTPHYEYWLEE